MSTWFDGVISISARRRTSSLVDSSARISATTNPITEVERDHPAELGHPARVAIEADTPHRDCGTGQREMHVDVCPVVDDGGAPEKQGVRELRRVAAEPGYQRGGHPWAYLV